MQDGQRTQNAALLEGQAKTLPRHDQRRAQDLRHVDQILQQQHVVQAEREPDRVGQNFDLVAGCRFPCTLSLLLFHLAQLTLSSCHQPLIWPISG